MRYNFVKLLFFFLTGLLIFGLGVQPTYAQEVDTLQWGSCPPPPDGIPPAGMQCAKLSVPLDYRNPQGSTIDIAISRIRSSNPQVRRGVLLANPGGPGGAGLDLPRFFRLLFSLRV